MGLSLDLTLPPCHFPSFLSQRLRGAFDALATSDGRLTLRTFLKLLSEAGAAKARAEGGLGLTHANVLQVKWII